MSEDSGRVWKIIDMAIEITVVTTEHSAEMPMCWEGGNGLAGM